ncbi:hypothetical protein V6N12_059954 [Hibiscus sabdariffa]|uniref:Uncharacterized protein n=1 Tax=Hibiscus sabdariffa TaxID=183260 RepID=A0ABR2D317_9ROSI
MEPNVACGGSTLLPYILELISRPWKVRMQHVCRGDNILDDRMAKMALEYDLIVHRYLDPPFDCQNIVAKEAGVEAATVLPYGLAWYGCLFMCVVSLSIVRLVSVSYGLG